MKRGNAYQNSSTRPDSCEQIDDAIFVQEVGLAVPQLLISARSNCMVRIWGKERRTTTRNIRCIGINTTVDIVKRKLTTRYQKLVSFRLRCFLNSALSCWWSIDRRGWFSGWVRGASDYCDPGEWRFRFRSKAQTTPQMKKRISALSKQDILRVCRRPDTMFLYSCV